MSDVETEDLFSDPEDFVDDISDEALLGDLLKLKPKEETRLDNIIVVDNAPKVNPDRMERLKSVLKKIFGKFGTIVTEYYPVGEDGVFKGYFFMEYSSAVDAAKAVETCNGYRLDKFHNFAVNLFTDFEKFAELPEKWSPPEKMEFVEIGNLRSWLLNEHCYDQYSVIYSDRPDPPKEPTEMAAVCYNTPIEPQIVVQKAKWSETYLQWSPLGTYLTTFHPLGVMLSGTEEFVRQARFSHRNAQLVDFSPCERYIVTFSNVVEDPNDPQNVIIWEIKTGAKKRTFTRQQNEGWPVIKWSHDGQYFARKGDNVLSVYEVPSFGLLDKKSIVAKGIRDFAWSPADNLIAYWVPEQNEIPTKIIITRMPSKQEISTKSRHLVSDCKLQWHKQGTFLCVRVDHFLTKSKKQLCSSFEIFHTKEALIPVDAIEVKDKNKVKSAIIRSLDPNDMEVVRKTPYWTQSVIFGRSAHLLEQAFKAGYKDPVIAFGLEPNGTKLAVIHGEPPTRISVTFYNINEKGNPPTVIKTLERQSANNIFWSPTGQFVVLAQLKSMDGTLDFIDTADMSLMNRQEHTKVTDLVWDPTGRYVVSSLSYWSEKMDTGYIVWSFQGKLLYRSPRYMDKFFQLQWRPRPPSLLNDDDIKGIKKDFKKYQYEFEQKDRSTKTKASKGLVEKRQKQIDLFKEFRNRKMRELKAKKDRYLEYSENRNTMLIDSREIVEIETLINEEIN